VNPAGGEKDSDKREGAFVRKRRSVESKERETFGGQIQGTRGRRGGGGAKVKGKSYGHYRGVSPANNLGKKGVVKDTSGKKRHKGARKNQLIQHRLD